MVTDSLDEYKRTEGMAKPMSNTSNTSNPKQRTGYAVIDEVLGMIAPPYEVVQAAEPTPRPWKASGNTIWSERLVVAKTLTDYVKSNGEAIDNAALIVRAVNNFDELVAALEQARETINELTWNKKITGTARGKLSKVSERISEVLNQR